MSTKIFACVVIFLALGNNVTYGFSIFNGWGQQQEDKNLFQQQTSFNQRTGQQQTGGAGGNSPIVLPCDGSPEITKACDAFCKSIRAAVGVCVPSELTCRCTGTLATVSSPITSQSQSVSTGTGIRVLPSPDLSNPLNETSPTVTGVARKRRSRRQIVQGSGPKDPANPCTEASCKGKCALQGYGTCSAECVGLSCYCRCP